MLMAGLDGIRTRSTPATRSTRPLRARARGAEKSRDARLAARCSTRSRQDHEFLLKGDVFTPDVIETWIAYKREVEVEPLRLRPHPYEFFLYYDV